MKTLLELALENQDRLNSQINPNWRDANYDWQTAIFMECAELQDHFNWKWWSKEQKAVSGFQIKLEIVDILHFCLSFALDNEKILKQDLPCIFEIATPNPADAIKDLVFNSLRPANWDFMLSVRYLWAYCDFDGTTTEIYKLYFAKTALNEFRQENGYKEGSYIKMWNGKEDNFYLEQILAKYTAELPADETAIEVFKNCIKLDLKEIYDKYLAAVRNSAVDFIK